MNALPSLLLHNDDLEAQLESFCANDPEFVRMEQQFYRLAEQIAAQVGFDRYDAFETCFRCYLNRTADLYYLFGLGLRQEILQALGTGG